MSRPKFFEKVGHKLWIAVVILIVLGIASGLILWNATKSTSLLSKNVAGQITGFTPYFYFDEIPAGYTFDQSRAKIDQGVLFLPLTKSGSPDIVLTEQVWDPSLKINDLEGRGTKIKDAAGPAAINSVEGRQVGVMVIPRDHTLVLLNCPGGTDKDVLASLLLGVKRIP